MPPSRAYQSIVDRFAADRQAASTALFRLAECYRKQGKTADADAAYNRLIAEFADQTALSELSRKQRTQAPGQPGVVRQDAVSDLERQELQLKLEIAQQNLVEMRRGQQFGVRGLGDVLEAQIAVLRAQTDVLNREALSTTGPKAETLRLQRRANLVQMLDLARQLVDLEERKLQVGTGSTQAVSEQKLEVLKLQRDLARLGR